MTDADRDRREFVAPVRPQNLLWLVIAAGVAVGIALHGTPHILFNYTYQETYPDRDGKRQRLYMECEYLGWHSQRVLPVDHRCPLFKLLKAPEETVHG